jgi:RND family efflux transporter MFP subunit
MSRRLGIGLALGLICGVAGCDSPKTAETKKDAPPAKVAKVVNEDTLGTIELTPDAVKRVGIETAEVQRKPVQRTRSYAGDIIVPPGRLIVVSAPIAGTLGAPDSGIPTPGSQVTKGQSVLTLLPLLSPEAKATMTTQRVEAEGQVDVTSKQLEQAKINLKRLEDLKKRGDPVAQGQLEDLRQQVRIAEAGHTAAKAREETLLNAIREAGLSTTKPMPIAAPVGGLLRNIQALEGQQVAPATLLFEIERVDPVWIRVPVYVGDVNKLVVDTAAQVSGMSDSDGAAPLLVKPVSAPPVGDPLALTVDLFYELPNPEHAFRPGQKVNATIPMKGSAESLVVPTSAIIYDRHGGTWVFEVVKERTYILRQVAIDYVIGAEAVLVRGPNPGTKVVSVGVAELFGAETGHAK